MKIWGFLQKYWMECVFFVLALCVYGPALRIGFLSDDLDFLLRISEISSFNDWVGVVFSNIGGDFFYRPLINLTFWMDYQIWGVLPFGYHLTNLLVFFGSALVLFWFSRALFNHKWVAFWITVLFVVSPFRHETVTWIAGRTDLFMVFFFLTTLLCWVYFRKMRNRKLFIGSLVIFLLALYCKESAVLLFPTLILLDLGFFRGLAFWKERISSYIPFGIALLAYFLDRAYVLGAVISSEESYLWPGMNALAIEPITKALLYPFYFVFNFSLAEIYPWLGFLEGHWTTIFSGCVIFFAVLILIANRKTKTQEAVGQFFTLIAIYVLQLVFILGYLPYLQSNLVNTRFLYLSSIWGIVLLVWLLFKDQKLERLMHVFLAGLAVVFFAASLVNFQAWTQADQKADAIRHAYVQYIEDQQPKELLTFGMPCHIFGAQAMCHKYSLKTLIEVVEDMDVQIEPVYGPFAQPELELCQHPTKRIVRWSDGDSDVLDLTRSPEPPIKHPVILTEKTKSVEKIPTHRISTINIAAEGMARDEIQVFYKTNRYQNFDKYLFVETTQTEKGLEAHLTPCEYPEFYSAGKLTGLRLDVKEGQTYTIEID